ncbi:MAG: hypothetical protein K2Y29_04575 [Beijerinckiaceae bacterium]|nr:hypothetical protein [Beijerinckiaceae bacterium]
MFISLEDIEGRLVADWLDGGDEDWPVVVWLEDEGLEDWPVVVDEPLMEEPEVEGLVDWLVDEPGAVTPPLVEPDVEGLDWLVVERSCEGLEGAVAPGRLCAPEAPLEPDDDGDELVCAKAGAASRVVAKR